jgi:hypothetical protein
MNRTLKMATVLSAGVIACASANAGIEVLNFVGLGDQEAIANYYDGGFGGSGSGPGPNFGITFGADSLALISSADGGSGNFANAPSDTVAFFLSGPGDIMDVAAGFTTGFSFFYADQVGFTGSVGVYSGLDGTGTLLNSFILPSTPDPYNVWVPVGVTFAGTAESVVFSGSANFIGFDDITLGSSSAGGGVPDNTGASIYVLAALGLAGAAWASRKQGIATV